MADERDRIDRWLESERLPPRLRRVLTLLRTVFDEANRAEAGFLAAAIAYFAFVSLVPLALLAVAVASHVGGEALVAAVLESVSGFVTEQGEELIAIAVAGTAGRTGATLVSLPVLVWSGLRVFRNLDRAFSRVYGARPQGLVPQVLHGLVVLVAVGGGLVGMTFTSSVVARVPGVPFDDEAGILLAWAVLTLAFVPMYTIYPGEDVGVREALPGAVVAGATFAVLGTLFGAYAAVAGRYALYGVLGAVLLVLAWLNIASTAIIYGAVLNAVLAGRVGDWATDQQFQHGSP